MRDLFRYGVAVFVVAVLTPLAGAGVVVAAYLFLPLPVTLPEARPTVASSISHVFDVRHNEVGVFRRFEQAIPIRPDDIPQVLKDAVIAAEDKSFYSHGGIDPRGIMRALWADVRAGAAVQGGSTITQQYVKNAYTGKERSISRKIREAIIAQQIDRQFEKDDILFRYLDQIYLGEGAFGVGAAAETYFRKPVQDLTLSEAALVAAVIPAPSRYSPRVDPTLADQRRLRVLETMRGENMITDEELFLAATQGVWLAQNGPPPGPATVIHPPVTQQTVYPDYMDYIRRYLERHPAVGEELLYTGGLTIETPLDPHMQQAALDEVRSTLDGTDPSIHMALASVEPSTGFVKAMVAGREFDPTTQAVNLALGKAGGGSGRQPGSSFKPYVLATALGQGILPTKSYSGATYVKGDYTGQNYGGASYGHLDLRSATRRSVNTVFLRLIEDVGVKETMDTARRIGLASMPEYDAGTHGVSIALGAAGTSPLEMASAYGVFANHGDRLEPTPVVRVVDREGVVLIDNSSKAEADRVHDDVIKPEVADNVTDILQGVLTAGTASGRGIDRPAAGKTGTTQNSADAWFVGYTPALSTAVWMGRRDSRDSLYGVKGVGAVTGGSFPARTWQAYMRRALEEVEPTDFNEPPPLTDIATEARVQARKGFGPGPLRSVGGPGGGSYRYVLQPPPAELPTTTTTSTTTSTTTTTIPEDPIDPPDPPFPL